MSNSVGPSYSRTIYVPAGSKFTKTLKLGDDVELAIKGRVESISSESISVQVVSMKGAIKGNSFDALNDNWSGQKQEEQENSNELLELLTPVSADFNRGY